MRRFLDCDWPASRSLLVSSAMKMPLCAGRSKLVGGRYRDGEYVGNMELERVRRFRRRSPERHIAQHDVNPSNLILVNCSMICISISLNFEVST